jgi:hypothetical protein
LDGCGVHVSWYGGATQDYFKGGALNELAGGSNSTAQNSAAWEQKNSIFSFTLFFIFSLVFFLLLIYFSSFFCNFLGHDWLDF